MVVSSIGSCAFAAIHGSRAISLWRQTNANGPGARRQREGAENPSRDAARISDADQEIIAKIATANRNLPTEVVRYMQRGYMIRQHVYGRDAFAAHLKNTEILRLAQRRRRRIALLTCAYGTDDPRRWEGHEKLDELFEMDRLVRQEKREMEEEIRKYRRELQRLGYSPAEIRELVRRVRCHEPIEHVPAADYDLISGGIIPDPPPSLDSELSTEEGAANKGSSSDTTLSSSPPSRGLEASSTDDDCSPRQSETFPIETEARSLSTGRAYATGSSRRRPIRTPSRATFRCFPRGWSVVLPRTTLDEGYSLGAAASRSRWTRGSGRSIIGRAAEGALGTRVEAEPEGMNSRGASGVVGSVGDWEDTRRGSRDRVDTAPHASGGSGGDGVSTTNSGRAIHRCGTSGAARGEGGKNAPAAAGPPGLEGNSSSTSLRRSGRVGVGSGTGTETSGESTTSHPSSEAVPAAPVDKYERYLMKIYETIENIDSTLQGVRGEHFAATVGRGQRVQPAKIDISTQTPIYEDPFARVVPAECKTAEELTRRRRNGLISILEKRVKRGKANTLALRRKSLKNEFEANLRANRAEAKWADLQVKLLSLRQPVTEYSRARPEAEDCVAKTVKKTCTVPTEGQTSGIAPEERPRSSSVEKPSTEERMSKVFGMVNSAFCSAMRFLQAADWEGNEDDTLMVQALSSAIGPGYFLGRNVPVGSAHEGCPQGHETTSSTPTEGLGQQSNDGEGIESNGVQPTSRSSPSMAPPRH